MSEIDTTSEGEVEQPAVRTPREQVQIMGQQIQRVIQELNLPSGERPSVMETQAALAAVCFGAEMVADRLADDEGLRPAIGKALRHLAEDGAMYDRILDARDVLSRAVGL